jgi:hypothetical protein
VVVDLDPVRAVSIGILDGQAVGGLDLVDDDLGETVALDERKKDAQAEKYVSEHEVDLCWISVRYFRLSRVPVEPSPDTVYPWAVFFCGGYRLMGFVKWLP